MYYLPLAVTAALGLMSILYPPFSAVIVLACVFSSLLLITRPDIAFALFIGAESLISEDIRKNWRLPHIVCLCLI